MLKSGDIIGIIGGGQLARMMSIEASKLGYKTHIFANHKNSSALQVTSLHTIGDYNDKHLLAQFIEQVNAVTFEFENLPYETLQYIEQRTSLNPNSKSLYISQDRIREKNFVNKLGIRTTKYNQVSNLPDFRKQVEKMNYNAILKTTRFGYDGKGQFNINIDSNLEEIFSQACKAKVPLILEEKVDFIKELSIIVAKDQKENIAYYDLVENIHHNGILHQTIAPANLANHLHKKLNEQAKNIAKKILTELNYIGVMAIELFLDKNNQLIFNEFAPRPHNSGHFTIDACYHNQFEQAIRVTAGLDICPTNLHSKAKMINLIGIDINKIPELEKLKKPLKIHNYNKGEIKIGRKMGHYTILNSKI